MSKGILLYILFAFALLAYASPAEQSAVLGSVSCGLLCYIATICMIYQEYIACIVFAGLMIVVFAGLFGHEVNGYIGISNVAGFILALSSE